MIGPIRASSTTVRSLSNLSLWKFPNQRDKQSNQKKQRNRRGRGGLDLDQGGTLLPKANSVVSSRLTACHHRPHQNHHPPPWKKPGWGVLSQNRIGHLGWNKPYSLRIVMLFSFVLDRDAVLLVISHSLLFQLLSKRIERLSFSSLSIACSLGCPISPTQCC